MLTDRIFDICPSFCVTRLWTWQKCQFWRVDHQSVTGLIYYQLSSVLAWRQYLLSPKFFSRGVLSSLQKHQKRRLVRKKIVGCGYFVLLLCLCRQWSTHVITRENMTFSVPSSENRFGFLLLCWLLILTFDSCSYLPCSYFTDISNQQLGCIRGTAKHCMSLE